MKTIKLTGYGTTGKYYYQIGRYHKNGNYPNAQGGLSNDEAEVGDIIYIDGCSKRKYIILEKTIKEGGEN